MAKGEGSKGPRAAARTADAVAPHIPVTKLTPIFKMVFLSILGLTILAFVSWGILSIEYPNPGAEAKGFFQACSMITQLGFGAICGLVGGKAV